MASEGALDGRHTCEIGMSMAVERFLRSGFQVALPIIDDGYDLLVMEWPRCWRIQVKATSRTRGPNKSRVRINRGGKKQLRYLPCQIDAFVVANISTGTALCVPLSAVADRSWINLSMSDRYSDFNLLRKVKPKHN